MLEKVVIVGAGQAGSACAARLRALGFEGRITLIGEEAVPPYQRPPLSKKYLLGEMALERLYLKPEAFYAEQGINLVLGQSVRGIDRAERRVTFDDGEVVYDRLVLATGAVPRRLPDRIGGALDGVHVMRSLSDADAMAHEFAAGRRLLVVGGGYIGLEAAAVAAARGVSVALVELAPRILQRVAAPETADFFRDLHTGHGVRILEGTELEILTGEDRLTGARLADGSEIEADFAVVGVGVDPATGLAEAAGLAITNGIKTDATGRTSDPAIFAAGDCASFPWRDTRIRLESVQNAIDQAEHVAGAILGSDAPYLPTPWFWSDQYDCRLQIAGLNAGYDRIVTRPGHRPGGRSVWYFRGGEFLAVDAMNDAKAYMQGKRWLEGGTGPDPDRLADPGTDLRALG